MLLLPRDIKFDIRSLFQEWVRQYKQYKKKGLEKREYTDGFKLNVLNYIKMLSIHFKNLYSFSFT